jgi:2-amino-4-hydroxy-6-hydroxymethyldihydropteridine diphosphokinase
MECVQKDRYAFVALGSNKTSAAGPPERTVADAIAVLASVSVQICTISRFFQTPAFPAGAGPDCVNLADFFRVRQGRWGARTLDLDLLAMDDLILPDPAGLTRWIGLAPTEQALIAPDRLILPHPRLQDRGFVLIPWADIAPDWRHPLTGLSVREMLDALPDAAKAEVRPF